MKRVPVVLIALLALASCTSQAVEGGASRPMRQPVFEAVTGSPIPVGPMAGEPAVGDCNNDGNPDIVLACGTCCGSRPSPESGHVIVLLGNGRGEFKRAKGSPIVVAPSARKVALGDVNRDRNLDILVAQHDNTEVTILLGDGRGEFKAAANSPVLAGKEGRSHTHDIATADVNADGNLDVLTTNAGDNTISVLLGDGKGGFKPAEGSPVRAGRHPYDVVAVNDLNADGKLDLVTPNLMGNAVTVMMGDGKGGFASSSGSPFPLGPRPGYVAIADLNDDGKPDIVATHDDDPLVAVLLGDGAGGFKPAAGSPINTPKSVWGTAIGDVNGDGKKDLVMGSSNHDGVTILLGDGKGGFALASSSPLPAGKLTSYVALADFNKDGKLDIVASNYASGDLTVLLNATK
jgi:FG-GAP-like repeat